ncbi:MAG TPA: amino acid permease [Gemmatirosa sp.]|nr:amino acid permease [Gemmatirosa sp.]
MSSPAQSPPGARSPAAVPPGGAAAGGTGAATLVRALGVWGLAASIFNVTVGGGIFRLPASAAAMIGPAAPLVYLVCAAVMGLIVLCFAEAGSRVSLTGGPYAYVEVVFGRYAGFLAGVLVWMLGTGAVASVATAYAGSVAALVPALGAPAARAALLVGTFALLAWINARGVKQGARLIEVVSVAKLLPLLVLVAVGAFFVRPANLAIPTMPGGGEFARAAIVLIFAFTGVESALVPSGEVRDPARTVPRALAVAMIGVTLLYLGVHVVAQGVLGGAGLAAAKDAPLAAAAGAAMGPAGRYLLLVGATVSMFGYLSGMTLAVPRALFTFGRDGFLPRVVGAVHRTHRTPHVAIWVQSAVVCTLAVGSSFETLAVISNLSALLLYLACAVAGWELRRRGIQQTAGTPVSLPGGPLIPILTVGVILWLFTSITRQEWLMVGATLAVATALFLVTRSRRAAIAAEPA